MKKLALLVTAVTAIGGGFASWQHRAGNRDELPSLIVAPGPFERRVSADGTLRAVTATTIAAPDGWDVGNLRVAWLAPDGSAVEAGDVIARFDPTEVAKALREAQAELDVAEAALKVEQVRATATIAEADTQVALAVHDLEQQEQFQSTDPAIFSRNQIIESELDTDVAVAHASAAKLAARIDRSTTRTSIDLARIERDRLVVVRDRIAKALGDLDVHAPHDGVLVLHRDGSGDLPKIGGPLDRGHELGNLPDVRDMEAELFVLEVDGDGIAAGQRVDLAIESRPGELLGGTVKSVDKVAKPRQDGVPVQYFSVVVSLPATDAKVMKPGARVRAKIDVAAERAIAVPRQAVFERAGHPVVFRRDLVRGYAPLPVELGAATSGRVVVTSGLVEGDVIALREPVEVKR